MAAPPVTIDSDTTVTAMPFDWSQFLVDLRGSSAPQAAGGKDGVLVPAALAGAEFNINIAFGAYKGTIQPRRVGEASVG